MDLYISQLCACVNGMGDRIKMCFPDTVNAFVGNDDLAESESNFMKWVTPEQAIKERKQGGRRGIVQKAYNTSVEEHIDLPRNSQGLVQIPDTHKLKNVCQGVPKISDMSDILSEARRFEKGFNHDRLSEDNYLKRHLK